VAPRLATGTRPALPPAGLPSLESCVIATSLPGLRFRTAFTWTGTFGETPDGMGHVDARRLARRDLPAGLRGNGITFAFTAAGDRDPLLLRRARDAELFSFER
jgi:hypothetical protein